MKHAFITGGTGTIGSKVLEKLIENDFFVHSISSKEHLIPELNEKYSGKCKFYYFDLLNAAPQNYEELAKNSLQKSKALDYVGFFAGSFTSFSPIEAHNIINWYKVNQINLHSTFLLLKILLPIIKDNSTVQFILPQKTPKAYGGTYAITTAALEKLVDTLNYEKEGKLKIVKTCLPPVATKFRSAAFPAENPATLMSVEGALEMILTSLTLDQEKITCD